MIRHRLVFGVVLAVAVLLPAYPALAQTPPSTPAATVTGTFTFVSGDPQPGSGQEHQFLSRVTDDTGRVYVLNMSAGVGEAAGGVTNLNGKRVTVRGDQGASSPSGVSAIDVRSVEVAATPSATPEALTGTQKFVTILCRFADSTGVTPRTVSYVQGLLGDTPPGISDFWRENSFALINNTGSTVQGWYNLPQPRSYYIPGGNLDFGRAATDCTAAADAAVNFNDYVGINLLFNQNLDCCAWGGGQVLTLDGTNKSWPMTWMPPWGYSDQRILGHEMGHAYGLPHSSGNYGAVYDSGWDVMSNGGGVPDATYGSLGTNTIAYHKDKLGWIAAGRKYTAGANSCQVLTIDYLSQAPATSGTYLMAQIPTVANRFYTVEARKNRGYDNGRIPGEAIVIHDVLTTRSEPAHVMDATNNSDPNDAGAMWLPGETFTDAVNGVTISVLAATANGWSVRVTRGSGVCPTVPTISASPASVVRGNAVTATWANIVSPSTTDWVALFPSSGVADNGYIAWRYLTGTAGGNVPLTVPASAAGASTYELRLFSNNTTTKLATSSSFTVTTTAPPPTISASPSSVVRGNAVTATWANIASPSTTDWVALFPSSGAADNGYIAWRYLTGAAGGNVPLTVPATAAPGATYELRLFSNNTTTRLARSGSFTVTGALAPTISASPSSVVRGNAVTATWANIASPSTTDWVALFPSSGAADNGYIAWRYLTGAAGGNVPLTVPATAAPGATYELRLFSNNTTTRLARSGSFTVTLSGVANDNFVNSQALAASGTTTGTNVGATKEPGEPNHYQTGGKSVWYRWTAPTTATVAFDTGGSNFDTLLGVYTGAAVNSLTQLGAADDSAGLGLQSRVTFSAVAGTEYRIAVDGYSAASGNITLNWAPA